ncbi:unnamed protein product [Rotaria socialis]|uniref:Uncharacterized protein n=1 Tax=Rotaria socialis TaxID=392032 RepID=A0A817V713_9BILA|nr:unnamed protein product [Rotaria socialis]
MRKKQLNIFEDLTIFEQRILCHTLPKKFDGIPIATYQNLFENEANKIMQELKCRKLNDQLNNYELGLQHYEDFLKTGNYILRETDKSGIFHVGHSHSADYEKKAEAYRQKTGAYIELDSNPS